VRGARDDGGPREARVADACPFDDPAARTMAALTALVQTSERMSIGFERQRSETTMLDGR
jgi:hypothetical protein